MDSRASISKELQVTGMYMCRKLVIPIENVPENENKEMKYSNTTAGPIMKIKKNNNNRTGVDKKLIKRLKLLELLGT